MSIVTPLRSTLHSVNNMDESKFMRGDSLDLTDKISVKHPTINDIINLGYHEYSQYLSVLTDTSLDVADILWSENHIWYEDIKSEWDFFINQNCSDNKIDVRIIGSNGKLYNILSECIVIDKVCKNALNYFLGLNGDYIVLSFNNKNKEELILVNVIEDKNKYYLDDSSFKINELFYELMKEFLTNINWINKDYDFVHGGTKFAKRWILEQEYKARKRKEKRKNIEQDITFNSILSAMIAKVGNYEIIWKYPIYLFYDQYYRHCRFDDYYGTLDALHAGCIDTKKHPINFDKINWSGVIKK